MLFFLSFIHLFNSIGWSTICYRLCAVRYETVKKKKKMKKFKAKKKNIQNHEVKVQRNMRYSLAGTDYHFALTAPIRPKAKRIQQQKFYKKKTKQKYI